MALTPAADDAWEPAKNIVKYKLPPRRPPLERARSPTGGGGREPPPTPPTAAPQRAAPQATATGGTPLRPPGPQRARSVHEAARQAAQDEATRVRRDQDARRHRQERYQEEQPEPPLPSTAPSDSLIGWHAIDNLTVLDCAVNPSQMLFDVPHACIAGYAHAQPQVDVLSRTIHPCDIRVSILGKLHHKRRYRHKGCPSKDQLCCSCI